MTSKASTEAIRYTILDTAGEQVLERGEGLNELIEILELPDNAIPAALQLAHEVRLKHCGEDVEVEGIISIKIRRLP
jgi:biotin synthase